MQGWRTIAAVARELEITDRTLRKRLKEAGIHPARPGRTSMLSDTDVTNLCSTSPCYLVGTVASGSFLENSHNRDRRLARRATMRGFKVRAPNSQLARKIYYEAKR